jgi:hypothetical protein
VTNRVGSVHSMDALDKREMIHVLGRMEWVVKDVTDVFRTVCNLKHTFLISGIFHVIFLDYGWCN